MTYELFEYGFPFCHEFCARHYFLVRWTVDGRDVKYFLSLN